MQPLSISMAVPVSWTPPSHIITPISSQWPSFSLPCLSRLCPVLFKLHTCSVPRVPCDLAATLEEVFVFIPKPREVFS